jgi:hypothetical protein
MSVGSMEQTSQPYLRPQHSLTNLRRLRHQPDQSGSTQELPILLPMVDFDVSFSSLLPSLAHILTASTVLAQAQPSLVFLSLNSQKAVSVC